MQMNVSDKVFKAFQESLNIEQGTDVSTLKYQEYPEWTSVGHMLLVAALEAEFDTMLDTDDILAMSSYDRAVEIMTKYASA